MTRTLLVPLVLATAACAAAQSTRASSPARVAWPEGYRGWNHVKTLVLEAGHPLYDAFGGIHHVYVNDTGLQALRSGAGEYPDGTVFVFDLHEAVKADHAIAEGDRKFVGVMQRDRAAWPETGGWGFEVFPGNSQEGSLEDGGASCWGCHQSQRGGVYATWTP